MSAISDFIEKRLSELRPKYDALIAQIEPIGSEILELELAREALSADSKRGRRGGGRNKAPSEQSLKGMCLKALGEARKPLTSAEIQGWISIHLHKDIVRTSLAPQLSRLCADGSVINENSRYRLAIRGSDGKSVNTSQSATHPDREGKGGERP